MSSRETSPRGAARRRAAVARFAMAAAAAATLFALPPSSAIASPGQIDPASLCERAVAQAARRHGAPERLMRALAKVETGRKGRPWPWTVNAGGEGRWFDSKRKALAWAEKKLAEGVKSIDLGCLQINRIWHGESFRDLAHMLDPFANADYAARYLMSLERETGDWMRAAGFYHSRTKQHFERYSALVATAYEALGEKPQRAATPQNPPAARQRRQVQPVIREAAVKEIPDEMRVALWSGLLRRSPRALIRDLHGRRAGPGEAQSRRGGVALAFGNGGRSLLTEGAPLSRAPRRSVFAPAATQE